MQSNTILTKGFLLFVLISVVISPLILFEWWNYWRSSICHLPDPARIPLSTQEIEYIEEDDVPNRYLEKRALDEQEYLRDVLVTGQHKHKYKDPRMIWDLFEPVVDCISKDRIGKRGDGGKWLCNMRSIIEKRKPNPCIVYSFGVSDDMTFEVEFNRQFGCHTFSFDPGSTIKELHKNDLRENMSLYQVGLAPLWQFLYGPNGATPMKGATETFFGILDQLEHTYIDFLKIDVEGNEYSALPDVISSERFQSLNVSQILIEVHYFEPWGVYADRVISFFSMMHKAGYRIFNKEPNLLCGSNCIEYSWIHKNFIEYPKIKM